MDQVQRTPDRTPAPNSPAASVAVTPTVSVIVVNWNGEAFIEDCCRSLERQTWPVREFIVVDNGSTDRSREYVTSWAASIPHAQAIMLPENTGFCHANNVGFTHAKGEWIALLNTDAVADPRWLEELVRHGDRKGRVGMLASKILFQTPEGVIDKVGHLMYWDGQNSGRGTLESDRGQFERVEEVLWPDGCAALYHRKVFEDTGGFDENFFAFGDDADLGMRARLLGWKAVYVPTAIVHHRHSASFGVYSPLKIMLIERNRLLLAVKNFPLRLLVQNPYWTIRRYLGYARAVRRREGAGSQFVTTHGWRGMARNLLWSWGSALKRLPAALRRRRAIQRSRRLSTRQTMELLDRFQVDLDELTRRNWSARNER